ncbi:MAG: LuxR C-terminal-related transcriptional regulator [Candidatus Dormibacteraeota bacterium]|nr:LuxR C-terminal-related transcriptional regulator [Candidatus Dormibacteraeota bacterium]
MTAFLGGPRWPELDAVLARGDLPGALRLAQGGHDVDAAERDLVIGICHSMFHESDRATAALLGAFHAFGSDRPERAAVAAVFLGRLHFFVHDSPSVANGWFARARSLVRGLPDSLEHALASLPLPGCDIADVGLLRDNASRAVAIARRHGDRSFEAKALADLGTANVSLALIPEGMTLLDEAMAMVMSGEVRSPFASTEVVCNLLSSCGRVGDIRRADEWTRAADVHLGIGVDRGPAFLYAHCRSAFGLILCDVGRWDEAEVTLRLAAGRATRAGPRSEGQARAALAQLLVLQGRLGDAERMLTDRRDHMDALLPLAELHLARHEHAEASDVARQGLRVMGEDRMRAARLLSTCVEAELARGNIEAARSACAELVAAAAGSTVAILLARAAQARGRLAEAEGDVDAAVTACEAGLRALADASWPLLRADLHLCLARVLASTDSSAALAEARAAHLGYERLGSPAAAASAALLNALGVPANTRPRRADATQALSRREREVLELLRDGLSNADIAARLHNSVRTIEHHVSAILGKLGMRSRAEAAVYAVSLTTVDSAATTSASGSATVSAPRPA